MFLIINFLNINLLYNLDNIPIMPSINNNYKEVKLFFGEKTIPANLKEI